MMTFTHGTFDYVYDDLATLEATGVMPADDISESRLVAVTFPRVLSSVSVQSPTWTKTFKVIVARFGQQVIDKSVRLYLVPGYAHVGGVSFNANQGMSVFPALEDWVENGVAPGTLIVTDTNVAARSRTRPMCEYPGWPRYKGTGDINAASSFTCVTG